MRLAHNSFSALPLPFNKAVDFYPQSMLCLSFFQLPFQKESCKTGLMELESPSQLIASIETLGRNQFSFIAEPRNASSLPSALPKNQFRYGSIASDATS